MHRRKYLLILHLLVCINHLYYYLEYSCIILDGSSDAGVRRSRQEDQNVTALPVQANGQKTANPCEISVIPNTPERKRPRQSTREYRGMKLNDYY